MRPVLYLTTLLLLEACNDPTPAQNESVSVPAVSSLRETTLPSELQGAWREEDGSKLLRIEPDRVVESDGRNMVVRGVIRRDGNRLVLRNKGLREEWTASYQGATLRLAREDGATQYQRLDHVPPQVDLKPLVLPTPGPLPQEQIQAIQTEVARRFHEEQAILSNPERLDEYEAVRVANLAYLRQLLSTVGWIGEDRFGSRTSMQTVFMAKHTGDLQLLMTLLPYVEREFKNPKRAQTYAILYDAVQLELGRKQRYGTQVTEDKAGEPFVLPLEDPAKVDDYLGEIGLPPLSNYLTDVSNAFYEGKKKVRVDPREDG